LTLPDPNRYNSRTISRFVTGAALQRTAAGHAPDGDMDRFARRGTPLSVTVTAAMLMLWAATAGATEFDMSRLPVQSPNLCLACHTVDAPTVGTAELNPFGADFLANGSLWDSNLAQLDSDDDGCLNGVEVGDSDGDGNPDGNVTEQAGNPGVGGDCGSGSLVDEKTWGTLKAMFDGG
jgi:hypothetical protein